MATTSAVTEVHYPASDGKPLGETGWHVCSTLFFLALLKEHLASRPDVYAASNMFLYYEEGNPRANRAPDCMVIPGVGNHERRVFKTWVEKAVPAVIVEFSSDETYREDLHAKRDLYARLGVKEYFLFDPLGECLDPRLQYLRLVEGEYVDMPPEPDGGFDCEMLGLRLIPETSEIRLIDLETGKPLLTLLEKSRALEREVKALEREAKAHARERRRANREHKLAVRERERAEEEKRRADDFAAEVVRLKALLDQLEKKE